MCTASSIIVFSEYFERSTLVLSSLIEEIIFSKNIVRLPMHLFKQNWKESCLKSCTKAVYPLYKSSLFVDLHNGWPYNQPKVLYPRNILTFEVLHNNLKNYFTPWHLLTQSSKGLNFNAQFIVIPLYVTFLKCSNRTFVIGATLPSVSSTLNRK